MLKVKRKPVSICYLIDNLRIVYTVIVPASQYINPSWFSLLFHYLYSILLKGFWVQKTMIPLLISGSIETARPSLWALLFHPSSHPLHASFVHALTVWTTPKPTKWMIEKEIKRRFQVLVTEAQPLEAKEGGMKAMRAWYEGEYLCDSGLNMWWCENWDDQRV